MVNFLRPSTLYYALFNLTILAVISGAVILIANNLTQIPASGFIGGFAMLTLLLVMSTWLSRRNEQAEAASIWGFWTGIAYGLTLFSGLHWFDLTNFVPDLLLCWLVGIALLAFWQASTLQMGLVALLTGVWFYLVFLYGYGYLPGVVLLAALYFFVARRRTSIPLFLLTVVLTLLVINFYFYDLTLPTHFPLIFSTAQMLITLALLGGLHGVVAILTGGAREHSPWPRYGEALHKLTQVIGVLLLLPLTFSATWLMLRTTFVANLFGIVLGFGLFMVTAIFIFSRPTTNALRATFGGWALAYFLLAIVLDDHMMDMVHFTGQAYLPLVGIVMAVGVAGSYLVAGIAQRGLVQIGAGLGLLLTATLALMAEWLTSYQAQALLWFGVALIVWIVAQNIRRQMTPVLAPLAETQGSRSASHLIKEGAL